MVDELRAVLGSPPIPQGSWERRATYVSPVALGRAGEPAREVAERLAVRLRDLPGVREVHVRPNGFLAIEVTVPGEIVREIMAEPARPVRKPGGGGDAAPWPDFPRTWSNPGFVVKYAYVRAGAVQRWARELRPEGEPGAFRPELLDDARDRAVLRLLAELPSRRASREPGWPAYLERLAGAYHDAFEHAPAIPKGDEAFSATHAARLRMAGAVRKVLAEGLTMLSHPLPCKI
jgi:arginyl-tRNA synthetase